MDQEKVRPSPDRGTRGRREKLGERKGVKSGPRTYAYRKRWSQADRGHLATPGSGLQDGGGSGPYFLEAFLAVAFLAVAFLGVAFLVDLAVDFRVVFFEPLLLPPPAPASRFSFLI